MYGEKWIFFCIFSFIFTMVDKSKFHFFQSFLPYFRVTPPPHSVAEKTSKSVKILSIGFSTKTRKSVITRRKWFFQNFRKKCTYGDFDENFSKFAGCLGVKNFFQIHFFWNWISSLVYTLDNMFFWIDFQITKGKAFRNISKYFGGRKYLSRCYI